MSATAKNNATNSATITGNKLYQYAVRLTYADDIHQAPLVLSFLINIHREESSTPGYSTFLINRQQVFTYGEAPSLQADKCIDYSGKCIYPISMEVNNHDGRLHSITNIQDIKNRWYIAKERLLLNFTGDVVNKVIESMEAALANPSFITKAMGKDFFYQLYFFPLYAKQKHIKGIEMSHAFSLVANSSPVSFICTREIISTSEQGLHVEVKGQPDDGRSFEDIAFAKLPATGIASHQPACRGHLQLNYDVYADGMIQSMKGYVSLQKESMEDGINIEIDIYHNQKKLIDKNFEPVIKPVTYAQKKTFWNRFK